MPSIALLVILYSWFWQEPSNQSSNPPLNEAEISAVRSKAELGDPAAQFALGQAYDFGTGIAQNDNQACNWYRKAAEQAYAPAQNSLGVMYRTGRGVEQSKEQAVEWYRKAARQNYGKAMFNLGTAYFNGDGVAINDVSAYAWFLAAGDHGSDPAREAIERAASSLSRWQISDAYGQLAELYEKGTELQQDLPAAGKWYRKAAELGEPAARVKFAQFLVNQGGDQNYREALGFCEEAAKQSYPPASMCVGVLHEKGLGTSPDLSEAAKWYTKSAQLGNALAMQRLSKMYWNGSGVKQDRVAAYTFALLASTAQLPEAQRNRDAYEKELSPKEIEQGKKQVATWIKAHSTLTLK